MKKITEDAAKAFIDGLPFSRDNTKVYKALGFWHLSLWDNIIAVRHELDDDVRWTLQGWNTVTTRERLKGIGILVSKRRGNAFFGGCMIEDGEWYNRSGAQISDPFARGSANLKRGLLPITPGTYRMRGGSVAVVQHLHSGMRYPVGGYIEERVLFSEQRTALNFTDCAELWRENGHFSAFDEEHRFDLMERL